MADANNKLSPLSPGYPTSDLGSSPRSSISISHSAIALSGYGGGGLLGGMSAANWMAFRESKKRSSSDYDGDSDAGGHSSAYLTPGQLFSPAPFSPFSDGCTSATETPFSNRSPNLSPLPASMMCGGSGHFR